MRAESDPTISLCYCFVMEVTSGLKIQSVHRQLLYKLCCAPKILSYGTTAYNIEEKYGHGAVYHKLEQYTQQDTRTEPTKEKAHRPSY